MINTLDDYVCRSVPEGQEFTTNPNLIKKVDHFGRILPYKGNTVVFLLEEQVKAQLALLQREIYQRAGDMLGEELKPDTFHMTLHDLANGMPHQEGLAERMAEADAGALSDEYMTLCTWRWEQRSRERYASASDTLIPRTRWMQQYRP